MSLIDYFKTECCMMIADTDPDGEGGKKAAGEKWKEGQRFLAAIVHDTGTITRIAEQQTAAKVFTVTVARGFPLKLHDVIKRLSDNKIFRITGDSDDTQTPVCASFSFAQVTAEEWELTT